MKQVRLGVVGVGSMGKNHLRIAHELIQFDLVGYYDPDAAQYDYAEHYDIKNFDSFEEMLCAVDAVSIAAPSSLHAEIALAAAGTGKHALVEKPLALSSRDARKITDAFEEKGLKLMVGHVEQYNPVIVELREILRSEQLIAIEIRRCSPWNRRINDADVIQDLMIHDMDILCNVLNPVPVRKLSAGGMMVYTDKIDYAHAMLTFDNGVIASLTASRVTEDKIRDILIHTKQALMRVDLLNRTLNITRQTSYYFGETNSPLYRQENITERVFVGQTEPLRAELISFGDCILNDSQPVISGESATRAITLIEQVAEHCYND